MSESGERRRIAVIDGNSLMHRAYHAVPPTMNAPDGTPTNAVFGFLNMLVKFIDLVQPDAIVCAFDAGKPKFRIAELEQYKAQRRPMDDELRAQFPLIEGLLTAMRIPVIKVPGWEGDDILGTVAARDEERGYMTLLVTGDKDACQLASELTHIVTTKKGITDIDIMSPERVFEKYGITPEQFPDYLGLMGDSSDNIPGVPGVGEKTARKFLEEYETMEGLYEHAEEIKGKLGEKVRSNKDLAFLSRKIATIVRDLDFELDVEDVHWPSFDAGEVSEAFKSLGMKANLSKILAYAGAQGTQETILDFQIDPLFEGEAADVLLDAAISKKERVGVWFSEPKQATLFDSSTLLAVHTQDGTALFRDDKVSSAFSRIVAHGAFASLDAKADVARIFPPDTSSFASVEDADILRMDAFDVGLAGYVLNSTEGDYGLKQMVGIFLGGMMPDTIEAAGDMLDENNGDDGFDRNAALCASAVSALVGPLERALSEAELTGCYTNIDMPLVAILLIMERNGVRIDNAQLSVLGERAKGAQDTLKARVFDLAGHEFNIDSPKQLSEVLFEEMGIKPLKKTTRGYSTDASVLKELSKEHELPRIILLYREQAKIKSTYIDALPRMRAGDGRIHSTFNQKVTATGRLSSSDPNLQNIPVRTEFGRTIRECFIPLEPGHLFLSADYSQIELRLLAHLSGDKRLIAAFNEGEDFHTETASHVFGLPAHEITPELRSRAKAVNFGIVYGQQAYGLSQSLDIPFAEARDMIDAYFAAYPDVRAYLDEVIASAKKLGYAETMFGRRRYIPELKAAQAAQRGFGERTAMNHPMQGSAADIIKIAMRHIQERIAMQGLSAKMILQVHDELDFSVPETEMDLVSRIVQEIMEGVVELSVPLLVDVSSGGTWADAH